MDQSEAENRRLADAAKNGVRYNSLQYSIEDLQYPEDLSSSESYGGHRVIFLINVNSDSKLLVNNSYGKTAVADIPQSELRRTAVEENLNKINQEVNERANTNFKTALPYKRLKAAIALYVPNDLSTSYGVSWGEDDLGFSEAMAEVAGSLFGANDKNSSTTGTVAALAGKAALSTSTGLQRGTKTTPGNAKAEQIFQGVDFRTFNFNYDFAPKSENEAKNALSIIRMFRHHMLPEFKDNSSFLYLYPSEFEVKYYKGAEENTFLEKHFTAVLTNCSVTYTPNGQFSTFANGMPSQMRLALTFKELNKPTKDTSPYDRSGA
jgi:hypothetical protein